MPASTSNETTTQGHEVDQVNIVAKLEITMTDKGQIAVNGAIDNKLFAYGLLDCARDAINDYHKEQANKLVKLATPAPGMPNLKSGN